jgi:hypothetical protein
MSAETTGAITRGALLAVLLAPPALDALGPRTSLASGAPIPVERAKAEKELAAVAEKLRGTWDGRGGCVGRLALRPDGTYEWSGRGPGGTTDTGTWAMRWNGSIPTLILKCTASDDRECANTTVEIKLGRTDENSITLEGPGAERPLRFSRVKKESPRRGVTDERR